VLSAFLHDNEFIAPGAGHNRPIANSMFQAPGNLSQHVVADGMTMRIVYAFEAIQIDEK
jgi:hypothetical protein